MNQRFIKLTIYVLIAGAFIYVALNRLTRYDSTESSLKQVHTEIPASSTEIPNQTNPHEDGLKTAVEQALKGTKGTYGVVIKNLKTGESYSMNEHRVFEPASLYKLWIMAEVFNQIQDGKLKEDEILSQDVSVLNEKFHISSESAELTEGTITLKVRDALHLMIANSNNYAALLLTEKIRLSNVKTFLKENNFNESFLGEPPKTTAYDIATFLEKLYKGELGSQKNTQKMIDILKKQTINSKLPKYLPQEVSIAHKTGEIGYFTHDAGIVFSNRGDYVIVVMSESDSPSEAEERIANVSKAVFDYFEKGGTES